MNETILAPGFFVRVALPPFVDRVLPVEFVLLAWEIFPEDLYLIEKGTEGNLLVPTIDNLGACYDLEQVSSERLSCERPFTIPEILLLLEEAKENDTSYIVFDKCFALVKQFEETGFFKKEFRIGDIPF